MNSNTNINIDTISFSDIDMTDLSEKALTNIPNLRKYKNNSTLTNPIPTTTVMDQGSETIQKIYPNIVSDNTANLSNYYNGNSIPVSSSLSTTSAAKSTVIPANIISNNNLDVDMNIVNSKPISPSNTLALSSYHSSSSSSLSNNEIITVTPTPITKSKKGKLTKKLDSKKTQTKLKKKNKKESNGSENLLKNKNDENQEVHLPPSSNPSNIFVINSKHDITTPNINFTSPSPSAFTPNINHNLIKFDSKKDSNFQFKSLPPPSISSNINIIHGSLAHSNLLNSANGDTPNSNNSIILPISNSSLISSISTTSTPISTSIPSPSN
jgi:hypothetical protein